MIGIANFIDEIYKYHFHTLQLNQSNRYHTICKQYGNITKRILTIAISLYASVLLINIIQPTFFLISGDYAHEIIVEYPGIDPHTFYGSLIVFSFNTLVLIYLFLVTAATDVLNMILFVNMGLISSFVTSHLDELENCLRPTRKGYEIKIKKQLAQIILMNQKFNE